MESMDPIREWKVSEQIIEDPVTGLTLQFEVLPDGLYACRVFGGFPLGNREFRFDRDGQELGASTDMQGPAKPTWLCDV